MRGSPIYAGGNLSLGLNTRDAPGTLEFGQARDLANFQTIQTGALVKRGGIEHFTTSTLAAPVRDLAFVGSPIYLLASTGAKFYTISDFGLRSDITGATAPTNIGWDFVRAVASGGQGPYYAANYFEAGQQYTGTGTMGMWTATTGAIPQAEYLLWLNNRMWAARIGTGAYPDQASTMVFSDIGDPRSWPAANSVAFSPGDGEGIGGLIPLGPYMLVFKQTKTYLIYDLDTGANRLLSTSIGMHPNDAKTAVNTPLGVMFYSYANGVCLATESGITPISDAILPSLRADYAGFTSSGAYLNESYIVTLGINTWEYNLTTKSWWKHTFASGGAPMAVLPKANNTQIPALLGGSSANHIERLLSPNVTQDLGVNISSYWTSDWMNPSYFRRRLVNSFDNRQRLRAVRLTSNGDIDLSIATEFDDTSLTAVGSFHDGPVAATSYREHRTGGQGAKHAFSLKFISNTANSSSIKDFIMVMGQRAD